MRDFFVFGELPIRMARTLPLKEKATPDKNRKEKEKRCKKNHF
jgi:hypothetical protein